MARKKKKSNIITVDTTNDEAVINGYVDKVNNDVKYSLEVDPEDKYNMSDAQKMFISHYVQHKNVRLAAELTGIDIDTARSYYVAYSTQQEIRRINKALYHRQFSHRLLSIAEIGSYLSSLITDDNVVEADRLKPMEKVRVAEMLINLQTTRHEFLNKPIELTNVDIEKQIENLSIDAVRALLNASKKEQVTDNDKNDIIKLLYESKTFTDEEIAYLKTLSAKDLLELLSSSKK